MFLPHWAAPSHHYICCPEELEAIFASIIALGLMRLKSIFLQSRQRLRMEPWLRRLVVLTLLANL